jgi:hypothetical protein
MKRSPDYWLEVIPHDGDRYWLPILGDFGQARQRAVNLIAYDRTLDFCLVLSGDYRPGTIATNPQILGDAQAYCVKGAKRIF